MNAIAGDLHHFFLFLLLFIASIFSGISISPVNSGKIWDSLYVQYTPLLVNRKHFCSMTFYSYLYSDSNANVSVNNGPEFQRQKRDVSFSDLGPLKDDERRDLNCAVKEYLLIAGYRLTAMTFFEEVWITMNACLFLFLQLSYGVSLLSLFFPSIFICERMSPFVSVAHYCLLDSTSNSRLMVLDCKQVLLG